MKSIMVDIEALSTGINAAVLSIGVVAFNEKEVTATGGWAISKEDWHGEIDPSTVRWWMEQNRQAQEYSFRGTLRAIEVALQFADFHRIHGGDEAWANDPDFDLSILKQWWSRVPVGMKWPVHYREARSYRTLTAEARRLLVPYDHAWKQEATAHNPVDDAANQARVVIEVRKHLVALNLHRSLP